MADLLQSMGSQALGPWQCLLVQPLHCPPLPLLHQAAGRLAARHFAAPVPEAAGSRALLHAALALLLASADALPEERLAAGVAQLARMVAQRLDASAAATLAAELRSTLQSLGSASAAADRGTGSGLQSSASAPAALPAKSAAKAAAKAIDSGRENLPAPAAAAAPCKPVAKGSRPAPASVRPESGSDSEDDGGFTLPPPRTVLKPSGRPPAPADDGGNDENAGFSLPPPLTILKPSNRPQPAGDGDGDEDGGFSLPPPRTILKSAAKSRSRFGAMLAAGGSAVTPAPKLDRLADNNDDDDSGDERNGGAGNGGAGARARFAAFNDENDPAPRTAAPATAKRVSRLAGLQGGAEPRTGVKQVPAFRRFALPDGDDDDEDGNGGGGVPLYPASIARHAIARARPSAARAAAAAAATQAAAAAADEVADGIAGLSLKAAAGAAATAPRGRARRGAAADGEAATSSLPADDAATAPELVAKAGGKGRARTARSTAAASGIEQADENGDLENKPPAGVAAARKPRATASSASSRAVTFCAYEEIAAAPSAPAPAPTPLRDSNGGAAAVAAQRPVSRGAKPLDRSHSAAAASPPSSTTSAPAPAHQPRQRHALQQRQQPAPLAPPPTGLLLVLDAPLQELPWESLPSLRGSALYRCPNVAFGAALHARSRAAAASTSPAIASSSASACSDGEREDESAAAAAAPPPPCIHLSSAYYLLNPDGDLTETQAAFEPMFTGALGWEGTAGRRPAPEALRSALQV